MGKLKCNKTGHAGQPGFMAPCGTGYGSNMVIGTAVQVVNFINYKSKILS